MFGFGGDEKDKLEENMKEIKDLIESHGENDEKDEKIEESGQELEEGQKKDFAAESLDIDTGEQQDSGQATGSKMPGPDEEVQDGQFRFDQTGENNEQEHQKRSNPRSGLRDKVPEPPETKKLNVPEIDKGPLFIRKGKFRSAKQMIDEMQYLSSEIEQVMNQLEAGIEEDRNMESDARELLQRLESDRGEIKDIISQK
ncbi:MAG: hypothetical protein ABEJ56_05410 [Candidatus Nanohaloarchaea archaeon]